MLSYVQKEAVNSECMSLMEWNINPQTDYFMVYNLVDFGRASFEPVCTKNAENLIDFSHFCAVNSVALHPI